MTTLHDFIFEFQHIVEDFRRCIVIDSLCGRGLITSRRKALFVFANLLNRYTVAVLGFIALWPLGQHIGNVAGINWCAFVVEAEAVGGEIIEPNAIGPSAPGHSFLEDQGRCTDPRIRPEHTRRQIDDGL